MTTKFADFINEIEVEAKKEGSAAVGEIESFRGYFRDLRKSIQESSKAKDQICLIEEFFRREAQKPAWKRQHSCMISCPCSRCNNRYL